MPVQPMMCPRCGKEATEYDENKWQCLNPRCGAKFIYESPPETVRQEISISNTIKGATFTCCGCGGIFPMLQYPQYQCARCGEFFCSECKSKGRPITGRRGRDGFQCKHCVQRAKWRGALAAILLGGSLFGILLSSKKEDRPPISPPPLKKEDRPSIPPPLAFDPKLALAYNSRGDVWAAKKEYDQAIADYDQAIRLDPKLAAAYNGSAWIRATCPDGKYRDGKRAVESATRACELTDRKVAEYLDTLAAAYAETGDFDAAVKRQVKALLLLAKSDEENLKDFGARLRLYRAKKPYRE